MRASRTTAGMKTRNIRHKHPRRGVLPGRSARQRRQKRASQQEKHEPRRRYSCDCTGIAPPFLSFLRRFHGGRTGNPTRAPLKIAYRGAQEGPVRACGAGAGQSVRATAEGRRMGAQQPVCGAAWAWPLAAIGGAKRGSAGQARSSLCAVQRGRGRLRPSAARSAEAPDRRAPSPTPCKQTPSIKGAGNADIGEAVNFFILRCTFIKKIAREIGRKTDQDASS